MTNEQLYLITNCALAAVNTWANTCGVSCEQSWIMDPQNIAKLILEDELTIKQYWNRQRYFLQKKGWLVGPYNEQAMTHPDIIDYSEVDQNRKNLLRVMVEYN